MKSDLRTWDGTDPRGVAGAMRRARSGDRVQVRDLVAQVIAQVRVEGDHALRVLSERFELAAPGALEVSQPRRLEALEAIDPELRAALETAAANIERVAEAQLAAEPVEVEPGAGQRVRVREVPVSSAAIYAPGGRAPYPSTVLMGVIPARVAGVERVAVTSPPDSTGEPHPAVIAAAEIAGADQVFALGGAQAIAALAFGTESVEPVDVIAGPGSPWVQEAKLQVSSKVGIDGYAGPSELVVVADGGADPHAVALDVCAQAEHGADGLLVVISPDRPFLERVEALTAELADERPSVHEAPLDLVEATSLEHAVNLADHLAPEHLQLCCGGAAHMAERITRAGCVFVGGLGATAFGDYAAGSNHILPTGGAGRFTGPVGPSTFRRRISVVEMDEASVEELAPTVATIADAEGFPVHGESATHRAGQASGGGS